MWCGKGRYTHNIYVATMIPMYLVPFSFGAEFAWIGDIQVPIYNSPKAASSIPLKRFSSFLKPAWSPQLKKSQNRSKSAYKAWVKAGRPRCSSHPARRLYKEAKSCFRKSFRNHQRQQRDKFYEDLDLTGCDSRKLFAKIRKARGTVSEPTSILTVNSHSFKDEELPNAWADYFRKLSSRSHDNRDDDFDRRINMEYSSILEEPYLPFECFTEEEVEAAIKTLTLQKAAGPDDIDPEHLVFGGSLLCKHLTVLFNAIVSSGHIPSTFQQGLIIPIPKGASKDPTNPSNYRGITILSNINKILEKLVMLKIHSLEDPPVLNPLQGGFCKGVSCSHTAFLFQESVQSLRDRGQKAYVAFLDVKKAFDTVWHKGLLVKLHRMGVNGHLWHLIKNWYNSSVSQVLWDQVRSEQFPIEQGVRQGGVLSPFLYCVFVNELLNLLTESGFGVHIDGIFTGAPMYADDLALIAGSPEELQAMLDIVSSYAQQWHYHLNADKSVIMVFGESAKTRKLGRATRRWTLEGLPLREVDEYHHLGILRTVYNSSSARTNERATAGRSAFFSLNSIGSRFGCLHPLTSSRLYSTLCIPILLYGAELWSLTKTELLFLERVHRKILRTILGLPTRSPSSCLQILLGIQSISCLIQLRAFNFIISTANLPPDSLPKRVMLARAKLAPGKGIICVYEKILNDLSLPDLSSVLTSSPKASAWKSFAKKHLAICAQLDFFENCENYLISSCEFKLFKPSVHWTTTVGNTKLTRLNNFRIRLLVGCDGLNHDTSRFRNRKVANPAQCCLCSLGTEDAEHFISKCPALSAERQSMLNNSQSAIRNQLPDPELNPRDFMNVITGIEWIEDFELQKFCIEFLSALKSARNSKLIANSGP